MAYLINPQSVSAIEVRTYVLTPADILTIGSNPYQLSNKENWYPFFYAFECQTFTTFYNFTSQFIIINPDYTDAYFKPGKVLQDLQGIGLATQIFQTSGVFLPNNADYLNNKNSFFLTTDTGTDATLGDGDFTIKITGVLL